MRIVIIGPVHPYRGGISHFVTSLAKACKKGGHEVKVISFKRQYPAFLYPGSSDRDPSTAIYSTDADYLLDPINPLTWQRAKDAIINWRPDIVLINWWVTVWSFAFNFIAKRTRKEGITTAFIIHNVFPHERRWWDKQLARTTLRNGDVHILLSPSQAETLLSYLPDALTITCPLPLSNLIKSEPIPRKEARSHLNLPSDNAFFLFFGFVRPYKGLDVLLDSISILRKRDKFPHLIIAGEFWQDKEFYLNKIETLNLASQIHLYDKYIPNEDLAHYFFAANAFVAPQKTGTQSGALALALGFGLPAIATKGIALGVEHPKNVTLVTIPENDPNALADKMEMFLENPEILIAQHVPKPGDWRKLVKAISDALALAKSAQPSKR